jgi:hypothetical protein
LEIIPTLTAYQEPTGDWKRKRMWVQYGAFSLKSYW